MEEDYSVGCLHDTYLHLFLDQALFAYIGFISFVDFLCNKPRLVRIAPSRDLHACCDITCQMSTPMGFPIAPTGRSLQHTQKQQSSSDIIQEFGESFFTCYRVITL
ncbi:hypothetical protein CHARACLAT_019786 [Characodon lateralis]|uniref:Uncharacterized protein n=1 Tax=Characodon lateralis TaxID=208331 RepID=A0ABU7EL55_9TELE|nr:hypothetical protein [Characodon lateralis]